MQLGSRVYLRFAMEGCAGEPIEPGTIGTVVGRTKGVPQIDFGEHGVKSIAPHYVFVVDVPDGHLLPEDGQTVEVEDLLAAIAGLAWDAWALHLRVSKLAGASPVFGRS